MYVEEHTQARHKPHASNHGTKDTCCTWAVVAYLIHGHGVRVWNFIIGFTLTVPQMWETWKASWPRLQGHLPQIAQKTRWHHTSPAQANTINFKTPRTWSKVTSIGMNKNARHETYSKRTCRYIKRVSGNTWPLPYTHYVTHGMTPIPAFVCSITHIATPLIL